jgi:uncharacterized DUF497 family protein
MTVFCVGPRQSAINLRKHEISFEEAVRVFKDDHAKDEIDEDAPDEIHWKRTGEIRGAVVVVIYMAYEDGEDEIVRIISARFASRSERRRYREDPSH